MSLFPRSTTRPEAEQLREFGPILIAEDDADDREMILAALTEVGASNAVEVVVDGVELMKYLRERIHSGEDERSGRPKVILLDLNMPRMSGREALLEIKMDPLLRTIPVVVLTTSNSPRDVIDSYAAGANAYFVKPVKYDDLAEIVRRIVLFWSKAAEV